MNRKNIITLLMTMVCLALLSSAAMAEDKCVSYAKPYANSAKLLAISITTTVDALEALNKRANENEITSFNDAVASMRKKADEVSKSLNEKHDSIMLKAATSDDYTLCKEDLQEEIDALKEQTAKAKTLLTDLKNNIKDLLDQLQDAFFGQRSADSFLL